MSEGGLGVRRKILITHFAIVSAFVLFAALSANLSVAFIVGIIITGTVGGVALMAISCPKYSYPVMLREYKAFGGKVQAFSFLPPTECPNCGQSLQ